MIRIRHEPAKGPCVAAILVVSAALATGCAVRVGPDGEPLSEDQRITADVIRIAEDEEGIVSADLRVETRDGVVVLSGVQPALEPVSALLRRASRVRGVVEIVNRIRIIREPGYLNGLLLRARRRALGYAGWVAERSARDDLYRLQDDDRHHGDDGSDLSVAAHAGPRK